jgi:hypothetical protein
LNVIDKDSTAFSRRYTSSNLNAIFRLWNLEFGIWIFFYNPARISAFIFTFSEFRKRGSPRPGDMETASSILSFPSFGIAQNTIVEAERSPRVLFSGRGRTLNLEPIRQAQGKLFQDLLSPREGIGSLTQEFENPTSTKNLRRRRRGKKYAEWDKLMRSLFVRRK